MQNKFNWLFLLVYVKIYNKLSTHELRGWKVRLVVNNDLKDIESSNVIGVIEGEQEPDRYIIIGKKELVTTGYYLLSI